MISTLSSHTSTLVAYIGPGGGISLLGPLLGVALAVIAALGMIAVWPLRLLLRRIRGSHCSPADIGVEA